MVYLQSYFDESGTIENSKYLTFCGFVGTNADWSTCHRKWGLAKRELDIKYFKANRAFRYKEALSKRCPATGADKRVEALTLLVSAIRDSIPLSVSVVLYCDDFNTLSQKDKRLIGDDPTYRAFLQALVLIKDRLGLITTDPEIRVSIICDDHHKYAGQYLEAIHRARQASPNLRDAFVSIGFADDTFFEQLQMADFLSSIVRQEAAYVHDGSPFELRGLYGEFFEKPSSTNVGISAFLDDVFFQSLLQSNKKAGAEKRRPKTDKHL